MPSNLFRVTAVSLNLRSEPVIRPANRIALLPQGQQVEKLEETSTPPWWKIVTDFHGSRLTGFCSSDFLEAEDVFTPPSAATGLLDVHLTENRADVTRDNQQLLAFPLGESGRPFRTAPDPSQLLAVVDFLAVDTSKRYTPRNGDTFCNIYAYDYCC